MHPKKLATLLISITSTVEISNFKFGIQLGFGTILPKKQRLGRLGPGEHPKKKFGTPYLFLQPLKLATEKLVHNMSSGLPCQTQALGIGSELTEYHSLPIMMMMQLCIQRAIKNY